MAITVDYFSIENNSFKEYTHTQYEPSRINMGKLRNSD